MAENFPIKMKTGFNLVQNTNEAAELKKNITTMVVLFSQKALRAAAIYVSHSNRNIVVTEDIKRGMMLETFIFYKDPKLLEEMKQVKENIYDNDLLSTVEDGLADDMDEIITDDEPGEYTENNCNCPICSSFNTIKARWADWEPKDEIEKILKKHIDNMK